MASSGTVAAFDSQETARPWWQLGLTAAVMAAAVNVIIFVIYQAITGSPLRVTPPTGGPQQDLPLAMILVQSILPALVGTLVAFALGRWTRSPQIWFLGISIAAVLLSLVGPLALPGISIGNKLALALMHLVVAGVTIATLVPRLSRSRT